MKTTVPYTPELNGKAERLNRTLLEKARAMILDAELNKNMWGEAVLCATYITNRSPSNILEKTTPAELFYGKKPNVNNLRIFGSIAYKHIPKEKQEGKFGKRCDTCIMVGYTHNGYRLWDPAKGKIIIGRDVIFDESKKLANIQDSAQVEPRTEIHLYDPDENKNLYQSNEENNEVRQESIELSNNEEVEIRRSCRNIRLPKKYEDYDLQYHALNIEAFINNVPKNFQEVEECADKIHWKKAIDEDIYMEIPEGMEGSVELVCKLQKSLYGLKQSSYCWNTRFNQFAISEGLNRADCDPCLYYQTSEDKKIFLLIWVDDMIIAGNNQDVINKLKKNLSDNFEMKDLGKLNLFLGIKIEFTIDGIYLSQREYVEKLLKRFNMNDCKGKSTPLEKCDSIVELNIEESSDCGEKPVRELIGCLIYIMMASRPDLSAAVNICSRYQSKPTEMLWKMLKRILRYLKESIDLKLFYGKSETTELLGYADSDWAGDKSDRKSTSGFVFKVYGATISWSTRKQNTVAMSSTEAEYIALAEAAREGLWLLKLVRVFGVMINTFVIYEDNQSCIKLTERPEHKRLKHVDTKYNFIKDLVVSKRLHVVYVSTNEQIADLFTKCLDKKKFCELRSKLNLILLNRKAQIEGEC